MFAICLLQEYSENKIVRACPAQAAQPDEMPQICFSKTDEVPDWFLKTEEMVAICLLQKYSENKIVRAGPAQRAQPAQPDGTHQIYFSKTDEMSVFLFPNRRNGCHLFTAKV